MKPEKLFFFYIPLAVTGLLAIFIGSKALQVMSLPVQAAAAPVSFVATEPLTEELTVAAESVLDEASSAPTDDAPPQLVPRYADLALTDEEIDLLAKVIYLEACGESFQGQQAVAEVILNRAVTDGFPDTVHDVLWEEDQFESMASLDLAKPQKTQYDAIDAALYGPSILPLGVTYFSADGENRHVWGTIGSHVFCYRYYW